MIILFIIFPLTLLKSIDSLKFSSIIGVIAIFYLIIMVIVNKFTEIPNGEPHKTYKNINVSPTTLLSLPIIILAHGVHVVVFPILKDLHQPTLKRMTISTTSSVLLYGLIYIIFSIFGYLTFYDKCQENILKNYNKDNISANIAKVFISIKIMMGFPLQLFSLRNTFNLIFFSNKEFSWIRHVFISFFVILFAFILGTLIPWISIIYGLVGSSILMSIFILMLVLMFTLPSLIYIKLFFINEKFWVKNKFECIYLILPIIILLLSLLFGTICFSTTVYSTIDRFFIHLNTTQ
jgi:amino acid permease